MDEMADREKVINAMEWAKEFKAFINELQIPRDDYKGIIAYIEDGAKLLKAQEPCWISVEERLPDPMKDKSVLSGWSEEIKPSDDVLCYIESSKRQTVAWYSYTCHEWTNVEENTVYTCDEITHWMPLPEPPKEIK